MKRDKGHKHHSFNGKKKGHCKKGYSHCHPNCPGKEIIRTAEFCPHCQKALKKDRRGRCTNCKERVTEPKIKYFNPQTKRWQEEKTYRKFCPKCYSQIGPDLHCPECGKKIKKPVIKYICPGRDGEESVEKNSVTTTCCATPLCYGDDRHPAA